jgi:hypothetical protein
MLKGFRQTMPPYSSPTPLQLPHSQELTTKIEQLQGSRAAVRRMKAELEELGRQRNLPLPPELMGIIFDFYVHLYGQLPEKLLLVCRTWHVLALSQPTLWTNLDPLHQFGLTVVRPWAGTFLQSRIARSNPAPLKVDFKMFLWDMTPKVVRKVAAIPTFRSRIQELIINRAADMNYLVGDQPLLKSLTIRGTYSDPLEEVIARPEKFRLFEKKLTTLCLHSPPKLSVWPDSLLRRLQTLEITLTSGSQVLHEYWTIIQKSTTLRTLHITPGYGSPPALSHPSVQHLSIAYPQFWNANQFRSWEEVKMPRLQDIVIETPHPNPLTQLKLVETLVLSLQLICKHRWSYSDIDPVVDISWVESIVCLLHTTSRLEKIQLCAPSSLVLGMLDALEKDRSLCPELNTFIINWPHGTGTLRENDKRRIEAKFDQLRDKVAAFIDKRQSCMLTR